MLTNSRLLCVLILPESTITGSVLSLSNFSEVAEELLKLPKEIEQLQKQLSEEQQQRLQMKQTIEQLLYKLGKKRI